MSEISLETKFWFGKHKGKTGDHVARSSPGYILWVERNLNNVTIHPKLRSLAVCVGMMQSEDGAEAYGTAADWGFE